jgi:hypothetical protein
MLLSPADAARHRTVEGHMRRWRDRVARRMRARDAGRPPWNRKQFLEQFWTDHPGHPGAVEFADIFEAAIAAARGNPSRFEQELARRLPQRNP